MMVSAMTQGGFFSESALDCFFQTMDSVMDCLLHGRFPVRHDDRLAAIATHFNHAGFVLMAGLVADCVAEVDIDPPDPVAEPTKRSMHSCFHVIGKLLAAMDVAVCSNLDQHRRLRGFTTKARIRCVLLRF